MLILYGFLCDHPPQLLVVMSLQLALLHGQLPQSLKEGNPASFLEHLSLRIMMNMHLTCGELLAADGTDMFML